MDPMKKKSPDLQTKNWEWYLRPPESISREYVAPGWNIKVLDSFENLIFLSIISTCNQFKIWLFFYISILNHEKLVR